MPNLHPLLAEIVEAHGLTTAREIAEQSAHKPLGRFGAKSVHKVVAEARAAAERGDRRQDLRADGGRGA